MSGMIKDGRYLFGQYTDMSLGAVGATKTSNGKKAINFENGFEALKQLDSNHDGVISSQDKEWRKLKVWRNSALDGVAKRSEMVSLDEMKIREISLKYLTVPANKQNRADGNRELLTTEFKTTDGKSHKISDIWFKQRDSMYSVDAKGLHVNSKSSGGVK